MLMAVFKSEVRTKYNLSKMDDYISNSNETFNELNFCRACLCDGKNMKSMPEIVLKNNETLLEMFLSFTNIKLGNSASLSLYLCTACEQKLFLSYTFLRRCLKSNEVVCKYISNQQCGVSSLVDDLNVDAPTVIDKELNENTNVKKLKRVKQPRLCVLPTEAISQALEESNRTFVHNVKCIKCSFVCSNSRSLSLHISHIHRELKDRWCVHCNEEFDDLVGHIKIHVASNLCQFCNRRFQSKSHLKEHLLGHSEYRPFKCEICQKRFITERYFNAHSRSHIPESPYVCHFCNQGFNEIVSLEQHLTTHRSNKTDSNDEVALINRVKSPQNFCSICNKNVRSLPEHVGKYHSNESGPILDCKLCTICGKQFRTSGNLRIHMRIHSGEMAYDCSSCERSFMTRSHLVTHLRTHTGEKPHVCHICGKSFVQSSVLNTHMKIHTGRSEVCKICGQKFCRPAHLRLHMRKHTGEKPYVCKECGRAFAQGSHLMEHIKMHNGIRPYKCKYCDKSFTQSSTLKLHMHIHLGSKPFKCTLCSYACRQSYSLQIHMKKHSVSSEYQKSSQDQVALPL